MLRDCPIQILATLLAITAGSAAFSEDFRNRLNTPPYFTITPEPSPSSSVAPSSAPVDTRIRSQVVQFYFDVYLASEEVPMEWQGDLSTCDAGDLSPAFREATLTRINYYRAMAGLAGDIVLDPALDALCQEASLLMSSEDRLSHFPSPSWACYSEAGADAARHSNLYLGRSGPSAVDGYIDDPYADNFFVGHRRWILYPPQRTMGSGSIPSGKENLAADALWVLGPFGPRPTHPGWIAWPPAGYVPYSVTPRISRRWSFSYPRAEFSDSTVRMTLNGEPISVEMEPQKNDLGYADNTLVWRPMGIPSLQPETDLLCEVAVEDVLIDGESYDFSYEVIIIDPHAALDVVTDALPEATEGATYQTSLRASGGQMPYTWRALGLLPAGLSLGPDGLLHGEPSESGTFRVAAEVTDDQGNSSTMDWPFEVIASGQVLRVATTYLPPGFSSPGSYYAAELKAVGGRPPYSWALTPNSEPLPAGLAFREEGQLLGNPTHRGSSLLTFQVTDAENTVAVRTLNLVIDAEPLSLLIQSHLLDAESGLLGHGLALVLSGGFPGTYQVECLGTDDDRWIPGLYLQKPDTGKLVVPLEVNGQDAQQYRVRGLSP